MKNYYKKLNEEKRKKFKTIYKIIFAILIIFGNLFLFKSAHSINIYVLLTIMIVVIYFFSIGIRIIFWDEQIKEENTKKIIEQQNILEQKAKKDLEQRNQILKESCGVIFPQTLISYDMPFYLKWCYTQNICMPQNFNSIMLNHQVRYVIEKNNIYDKNDIAIYQRDKKIGYLYNGNIKDMIIKYAASNDDYKVYMVVNKVDEDQNIIEIKIGFYRNLETSTNIDKFDTILVQSKYIEEDDRFAESDLVEINSWHYVTKINETYIIDDLGQLNKAAVNKVDYKNEQYNLFAKILDKKLGENLKYAVKVRIFKTPICYTNFRSRKRINNIKSFLENTNNGGIQNEKKN